MKSRPSCTLVRRALRRAFNIFVRNTSTNTSGSTTKDRNLSHRASIGLKDCNISTAIPQTPKTQPIKGRLLRRPKAEMQSLRGGSRTSNRWRIVRLKIWRQVTEGITCCRVRRWSIVMSSIASKKAITKDSPQKKNLHKSTRLKLRNKEKKEKYCCLNFEWSSFPTYNLIE